MNTKYLATAAGKENLMPAPTKVGQHSRFLRLFVRIGDLSLALMTWLLQPSTDRSGSRGPQAKEKRALLKRPLPAAVIAAPHAVRRLLAQGASDKQNVTREEDKS